MNSPPMTRHSMLMDEGTWAALAMVASLRRTSVSAELRTAATEYLTRYGLCVVDGQPVRIDDSWGWKSTAEEEIHGGGESTAEEEIHRGGGAHESTAGDPGNTPNGQREEAAER